MATCILAKLVIFTRRPFGFCDGLEKVENDYNLLVSRFTVKRRSNGQYQLNDFGVESVVSGPERTFSQRLLQTFALI